MTSTDGEAAAAAAMLGKALTSCQYSQSILTLREDTKVDSSKIDKIVYTVSVNSHL